MSDLDFDFGPTFVPSRERIKGESDERYARAGKSLSFGHSFLDDALTGILSNDLILVGAETGAGKTHFVMQLAIANARAGKRVHYVALEAEDREIERRQIHATVARRLSVIGKHPPTFAEWMIGLGDPVLDRECTESFETEVGANLETYYKGSRFTVNELRKIFLAAQAETDLLILDHLHYVDIDDPNENRGLKELVKTLRDIALGMGRPVILVAHLRKRDHKAKAIAPSIDDFHGASDIAKIATRAVIISPARCMRSDVPGKSNTFFQVVKDRFDGAKPFVALSAFNLKTRDYSAAYTLGQETADGGWQGIDSKFIPRWARRHTEYNHQRGLV